MANKLYEEANIKDIADAIREKNGSANTYTVAQMGAAVRNIQVGGNVSELPLRRYEGKITETVLGSLEYVTLVTDPVLAEHRNDKSLMAVVEFDIEPTVYTVVNVIGVNDTSLWGIESGLTGYQKVKRWDGTAARGVGSVAVPINTDSPEGVGCVQITENGELRVYSNSANNYAIRPCTFRAEVRWK